MGSKASGYEGLDRGYGLREANTKGKTILDFSIALQWPTLILGSGKSILSHTRVGRPVFKLISLL